MVRTKRHPTMTSLRAAGMSLLWALALVGALDANTTGTADSGASADAGAGRADGAGARFDGGGGAGGMVTTDSGAAGGSAPCGGLVCEDFESGSIDPAKWDTVAKGGTLAVQQQRVAHGK